MDVSGAIGLLVNTDASYGRKVILGIARVAAQHDWQLAMEPGGGFSPLTDAAGRGRHLAAVVQPFNQEQERRVLALRVPVVNVSAAMAHSRLPSVLPDSHAIGRLAADHLLAAGFHRFAYCGLPGRSYSVERGAGFVQRLAESGMESATYVPERTPGNASEWIAEQDRLAAWLSTLPRPLGVMACNDARGRQVLEACRLAHLVVPEQVAVIGVDNDELYGATTRPQLSSIDPNAELIGEKAAELLARLLKGRKAPRRPVRVPPLGVIVRKSSSVVAIADTVVVEAVTKVREGVAGGIDVDGLLEQLSIGRRSLELRFRRALGRTPAAEIRRVRLERARELLVSTDLSMREIAAACGFRDQSRFGTAFRREIGATPSGYRRELRGRHV